MCIYMYIHVHVRHQYKMVYMYIHVGHTILERCLCRGWQTLCQSCLPNHLSTSSNLRTCMYLNSYVVDQEQSTWKQLHAHTQQCLPQPCLACWQWICPALACPVGRITLKDLPMPLGAVQENWTNYSTHRNVAGTPKKFKVHRTTYMYICYGLISNLVPALKPVGRL